MDRCRFSGHPAGGFSYRLNKRTNLNLSIGAGLTDDTPDTTVTLRAPIRF